MLQSMESQRLRQDFVTKQQQLERRYMVMFCVLLSIYIKTLYTKFCKFFFSFSILFSQIASGNMLYSTGSSAWSSVMTQMDGMGVVV